MLIKSFLIRQKTKYFLQINWLHKVEKSKKFELMTTIILLEENQIIELKNYLWKKERKNEFRLFCY